MDNGDFLGIFKSDFKFHLYSQGTSVRVHPLKYQRTCIRYLKKRYFIRTKLIR